MSSLTITMGTTGATYSAAATAASGTGAAANAATGIAFFISPVGSDTTGNGTYASPWRSLTKAYAMAVAGNTIYCRGGVYSGTGTSLPNAVTSVGTAVSPITVCNYPGEIPIFDGTGISMGTQNVGILWRDGAAYHNLRGLTFRNWTLYRTPGGGSAILDTTDDIAGGVHHITVEDCTFDHQVLTGATNSDHIVYIGSGTDYFTARRNTFIGPGKTSAFASAFHLYHTPGSRHILFAHNIVRQCRIGVLLWKPPAEGGTDFQFLHNTFLDCATDADLRYGDSTIVRDNASNAASDTIYRGATGDTPNYAEDHNFYAQSFDANYYLVPGQTGVGAASDGTDAGALDSEMR